MTESGLRALDESLTDVANTKGGFVWRYYVIVDDGGEVEGHVVLGHADLLRNFDDLDLDIHLNELLG